MGDDDKAIGELTATVKMLVVQCQRNEDKLDQILQCQSPMCQAKSREIASLRKGLIALALAGGAGGGWVGVAKVLEVFAP
jgi:hypothetical protein